MKSAVALAAAALLGSASAGSHMHHRREAHAAAHAHFGRGAYDTGCPPIPCSTYVTSGWVPLPTPEYSTVYVSPVPPATVTTTAHSTSYVCVTATPTYEFPVPTPEVTTCPTPGIYTIPEHTVTLTNTATVCGATTVTPTCTGPTAIGATTTVVAHSTVIVCPVPTVITKEGTVTTKITSTEYVCPTAGTYTIGGHTTTVTKTAEVIVCPALTTYTPGTYGHAASTVTVTKTNEVVVCPLTKVTVTYKQTVAVTPVPQPTYAPAPPAYTTPKAPAYSMPSKPQPTGSGDHWAMVYTPYQPNGQCKTPEQVDHDISLVKQKGFDAIRMYSTDCDGLPNVGAACQKYGVKIILGVWITEGGVHTADKQVEDIIKWGKHELVILFTVGNEAIFNHWCTAQELKDYIVVVKAKLEGAGFHCPFTTAEPLNIYQEHPDLVDVIDVCGMNIHAFFNTEVEAKYAGDFVSKQIKEGAKICGGKKIYVCESGWPSAGESNGMAIPGAYEQKVAIDSIRAAEGANVVFLSYEDDSWKAPGYKGVEQHWGCIDQF